MEETDQRKESNRAIAQNTYVVVHNHSILKPLTAQTYKKMRTKEEAFEDFATSPNPNSFPRVAQRPPSHFTRRAGRSGVAAEGEKEADGSHRLDHRGRQDVRTGLLLALV